MNNLNPLIEKLEQLEQKRNIKINFMVQNFLQNVEEFYEQQPFFYDKSGQFWVWDLQKKRYVETDEVDLMNALENGFNLSGQTINSSTKGQYMEAFKRVGRKNIPEELPIEFIQFNSFLYNIKTDEKKEITPEYFLTNPIPWDLGESEDTPIMDQLFEQWVGVENKKTLYEIIAYCLYRGYPIHSIFALVGSGRNGKSQYQKVILKFLGAENVSSTDLDILLDNRFESIKLYKKLAAQMGETNFGVMKKTSLLKRLSGGDLIGYERKNQKPFDDYNYAKLLINSNALPSSYDTSEGFYRRWFIVDFPNGFTEGQEVFLTIPDVEYCNLAKKCIPLLKELLSCGHFSSQGSIEERRLKYVQHSNPFGLFLEQNYRREMEGFVGYDDLYINYREYLTKHKKRIVNRKEFENALADEGLYKRHTQKKVGQEYVQNRWVEGIVRIVPIVPLFSTLPPRESSQVKIVEQTEQLEQKEENIVSNIEDTPQSLILAFIKARQNDEKPNGSLILEALEQLGEKWSLIEKLASKGEIYSPRSDHWMVLE
jgi:putative DNA primase/helicase